MTEDINCLYELEKRPSEKVFGRPLHFLKEMFFYSKFNSKSLKTFGSLIKVISPDCGKWKSISRDTQKRIQPARCAMGK